MSANRFDTSRLAVCSKHSHGMASSVFSLLLTGLWMITLSPRAHAQAPGLLWATNIGARVFAVDAQTNLYANAGGLVFKLSSAGQPLQTNAVCPIPGVAQRDSAGNFYFAGSFDGTQDFGGITLVGGWTNWPSPGHWTPGYPTCFLAKYASNGALQWAKSFGSQANRNALSDLLVDSSGACYLSSYIVPSGPNAWGLLTRFDNSGLMLWENIVAGPSSFFDAIKLGGLTSSNCCFFFLRSTGGDETGYATGGWLTTSGSISYFGGALGLSYSTLSITNAKPVIDDLAQVYLPGICDACGGTQVLRKYGVDGTEKSTTQITGGQQWTLARGNEASVYLAGTNGVLSYYDSEANLIWSTNLGNPVVLMLVSQGTRFISFENGVVARLSDVPPAQSPSILVEPQPLTVFLGENFQLSVSANGTPTLQYFWRLHGTNLAGPAGSIFTCSNATVAQAGPYAVLITNAAGSITSAPALVRVKSVALYAGNQLLTNGTYAFASPPTLSIRSAFINGSSFYTLDDSPPSFASTLYSGPFTLSQNATVRAIGYSADFSQAEETDAVNAVLLARHNLLVTTSGGGIVTTNSNPSPADANCVTRPSGAVAWWRAENNFTDAIGGHSAVAYGNTTYANGMVGQAFHFDGEISRAQVRVADAADLRFTTAMTVEAWVKPEGGATVVSKWSASSSEPQSSFRLSVGSPAQDLKAYFEVRSDGDGGGTSAIYPPYCSSVTDLPLGIWTHLACTYDGSKLRIFVNGALSGQTPWSGGIYSGGEDLGIGGMVGSTYPGGGFDHYAGMVDELALYDRALSPAEIQAIYQAGQYGKCISPPFAGGSYPATDTVTLTAVPMAGYVFLYWLGDASGPSPTINVSMERDKAIHAVFGTTLSTSATGNGSVQVWPPGGVHPVGTTLRLTAIPQPGNYFGFWGNAATGNTNPLYFTITGPTQTVSSIFAPLPADQSALTVLINGQGRVNADPRANAFPTYQSVTLTAVADSGQSFLNWSGDASGTQNPLLVSMSQSRVITANFSSRPWLRADRPGVEGWTPAGFRLTVVSDPQTAHEIRASTNLNNWTGLGRVTNDFGEVQFTDTNAPIVPAKFYQAAP